MSKRAEKSYSVMITLNKINVVVALGFMQLAPCDS